MTYEHIFRRPNLARTAAQLKEARDGLLWVVIEDTHSLRKMASSESHYRWIVADTEAYIQSLGVPAVYIAERSPFPAAAARSPKIETHQRNLGLTLAYSIVENRTLARELGLEEHFARCTLAGKFGEQVRADFRSGSTGPVTPMLASKLLRCPVVYIADDDNVYTSYLWEQVRRVMRVALFPTGNMGFDGIEGPIVLPRPDDPPESLQGRVVGWNCWHGSDPAHPRGWDKGGADRRFKGDMAGIAFNAVMQPKFTGPRYGYHETNIVEQCGVQQIEQIEGTMAVLAHHVHNEKTAGRLCYPIDWNYSNPTAVWFNTQKYRLL